jgi:hypothetical protein
MVSACEDSDFVVCDLVDEAVLGIPPCLRPIKNWQSAEKGLVNMNTRSEALTTPMLDRAALSLPLQGVDGKRALAQG